MKIDWFDSEKYFSTNESVKINFFNSEKYFFTDESVKRHITDSISENLTDSDLESTMWHATHAVDRRWTNVVLSLIKFFGTLSNFRLTKHDFLFE